MYLHEDLKQRVRSLVKEKWDQHPHMKRLQFQGRHPHLYPFYPQHPHPLL